MTAATTLTPTREGARKDILLESGTNELEVLVFQLGGEVYGVNVVKVREVILPVPVVASPNQPPAVLGVFNLRGHVLPLVDMHRYLNIKPKNADPKNHRIIVTEFNGARASFLVESVEQIYRMSWKKIRPIPESTGDKQFIATGITEIKDRLVMMLDFESVVDHISMHKQLHIESVENTEGINRGEYRIFLSEDSNFIREIMHTVLTRSGYTQVECFTNGMDAWRALEERSQKTPGQIPHIIVSDIEMPQMDGLALTRQVKSNPKYKQIPVILFSSLITEDTLHKGRQVGADDQLAKPQLKELVQKIDHLVQNTRRPS
jgi:two-component system chemotaxis response regulator CheV